MPWTDLCALDAVDNDDVIPIVHGGRDYAIYRTDDDAYFCSDGRCTHEDVLLANGLLMGHVIECPKHNGRFDIRSGAPLRAPVCVALTTYPTRIAGDRLWVDLPACAAAKEP
jgi:3-phenylpropionate/trans-cinnamate dioxygenase ferredoxin component